MSNEVNQDIINSTNEQEDQPERSATDPRGRGASGSVPAPGGCVRVTHPTLLTIHQITL